MATVQQPLLLSPADRAPAGGFVVVLRQNRRVVRNLAQQVPDADRYAFACRFTVAVLSAYSQAIQAGQASTLSLRDLPPDIPGFDLDGLARAQAAALGRAATLLDPLEPI